MMRLACSRGALTRFVFGALVGRGFVGPVGVVGTPGIAGEVGEAVAAADALPNYLRHRVTG